MKEQLGFYKDVRELFTESELEEFLADDRKFYRKYAEKQWLNNYHRLQNIAKATHIPSITSVLSDMPMSSTRDNKSDTEIYALKSVESQERLDFLHNCIDNLPHEWQAIIDFKFLTRNRAGQKYNNNYIADELGLSHATFYRLQQQALYELGLCLYQYELLSHEKDNDKSK